MTRPIEAPPPPSSRLDVELLRKVQTDPEAFRAEQDGQYLHWDELRRRPPRSQMSHQEWWLLVKLARSNGRQLLPFTAEPAGQPFSFVLTQTVQRHLFQIEREASGRVGLPEDIANPATRDRYVVSSLIEEAFRSSQLEGASTERTVAKDMLRTKRSPRTKSERMILNNFHAMEWIKAHVDQDLTVPLLFELHEIVTRDTLEISDGGGRFRRADESIAVVDRYDDTVVHEPPSARLLPERCDAFCRFANETYERDGSIPPVLRAILLHFWLAHDHPFVDGNGRTARALFYWSMLRQGYWLTEFVSISRVIHETRAQYDRAFIYSETDDNDATYFLLNQLKGYLRAIDALNEYLKRKSREIRELETHLRGGSDLNSRQLAIVGYLVRHPEARITIEHHQNQHRVVYQTARTDLLTLVKQGLLTKHKDGKKFAFAPVPDLARRMKS